MAWVSSGVNLGTKTRGISWCLDTDATTQLDPSTITNSLLFQYNTSVPIYHCPADLSMLETVDGTPLAQPRWRSYNMSESINGYSEFMPPDADWGMNYVWTNIPSWKKFTEIRHPVPSELFVFIDENEDTILDAQFGSPPLGVPLINPFLWWDMPGSRHLQGANLSFADGHVEHWKWRVPMIFNSWSQRATPEEMPDKLRIEHAMKQPSDN